MNDSLDDLEDTESIRDRIPAWSIFLSQLYEISVVFVSYSLFAFLLFLSILFWIYLGRMAIEAFGR